MTVFYKTSQRGQMGPKPKMNRVQIKLHDEHDFSRELYQENTSQLLHLADPSTHGPIEPTLQGFQDSKVNSTKEINHSIEVMSRQDIEEGIYENTLGKTVSPLDLELVEQSVTSRNTTMPRFNQTIQARQKEVSVMNFNLILNTNLDKRHK